MAWIDMRRDETPASDEWRPAARRKKSTKKNCGGKPGRVHDPVVQLDKYHARLMRRPCGFSSVWPDRWQCSHQSVCSKCGKILEYTLGASCPVRQASVAQK